MTRSGDPTTAWLRVSIGAALGAVLGVAACGAQQAADPRVVSSDPVLVEMASGLLPDLAARSGLELREPVRLERRTRAQLTRYLEDKLDQELPPAEAQATVDVYALLGLVPPDLDLRAVLLGLYTEQVAGFYEPDSTALFVMDDQPEEALQGLLVHELVHAIQDQNVDLSAFMDPDLDNDRATAAQAAIEGHATLVMLEHMTEQMLGTPIDISEVPDFSAQMRPLLQGLGSQFPALAGAPRIIQEALLFPYLEGTGYVQALWANGERVAPFGDYLPESTEQVLAHDTADEPVTLELTVTTGPNGPHVIREDGLGRLEVGILLEEHGADGTAADGWEGDRYALVELADGTRALAWYAVWEDASTRSRFMRAMQTVLPELGAESSLEAVDVSGRPATLLRVGKVGEVSARSTDRGS
ncbi:MAG: hypothetical protein AB7T31_08590 [Gemmatimonadales bacterium]